MRRLFVVAYLIFFCLAWSACTKTTSEKEFFIGTWTPLSRSLLGGGEMIVDKSMIRWAHGEKVQYEVITKVGDDEYVVQVIGTRQGAKDRGFEYIGFKRVQKSPEDKGKYSLEVSFTDKIEDIRNMRGGWGVYLPKENAGSR